MFRKLGIVIVLGLFIGCLEAQTPGAPIPTVEQVRALLQSPDARDQAWGAWWAVQGKMTGLTPLLNINLEAQLRVNPWQWQDDAVIDSTLDALMQLPDSPLSIEALESLYPRRPVQSIILLSRLPPTSEVNRFLATQLDRGPAYDSGGRWFAVANLLLARHSPEVVSSLLRKLKLKGHVTIHQPGLPDHGTFTDTGVTLPPGPRSAPDFPPWPTYPLITSSSSGVIVASGPIGVAYLRKVINEGSVQITPLETEVPRPTPAEILTYLGAAGPNVPIPVQSEERLEVQWTNLESYKAKLESFRKTILDRYSTMIAQLVGGGYLTPAQATTLATPNLQIVVDDRRSNRTDLN